MISTLRTSTSLLGARRALPALVSSQSFSAGPSKWRTDYPIEEHILSTKQFTRSDVERVLGVAKEFKTARMKGQYIDILKGKVQANVFYEPSTRTSMSFDAAMQYLGGRVIRVQGSTMSVQKGETLRDTVRAIQPLVDCLVIRHPEAHAAAEAAHFANKPIVNAGDGPNEHPSQALLDSFCISELVGKLDGIKITMVGDLKYGRTVHSLSRILAHFNCTLNYVSPPELCMPQSYIDEVKSTNPNVKQNQYGSLDDVIGNSDVLYITRVQKERFADVNDYNRVKDAFIIDNSVLAKASKNCIVMHPFPRVNEIAEEVDADPRAKYFDQVQHGLYTRMALLAIVNKAR